MSRKPKQAAEDAALLKALKERVILITWRGGLTHVTRAEKKRIDQLLAKQAKKTKT